MASSPAATFSAIVAGTGQQLSPGLLHVARLELIRPGQSFAATKQDRRCHPLDHVAYETTGKHTLVQGGQRRFDRTAAVVAEYHDQRHAEHRNGELDRTQHRGVDHVTGGANHEHVAQALVEDELGGHPAVAAAEQRDGRFLAVGQAGPMRDALARVFGLAGDEPLVTLFE